MKYACIKNNKPRWPVCVQCRVLGVSASGYLQHRARREKILIRRDLSETALLVKIRVVYTEARRAYGCHACGGDCMPAVVRKTCSPGME